MNVNLEIEAGSADIFAKKTVSLRFLNSAFQDLCA